jgi:hypothetical protein
MRYDPVQNIDQIKEHVFALVGHRQMFARMLLGLPNGGYFEPHARPKRRQFLVGQTRIEPVEQILRDALLFAQNRAARGFRRVRREYRFDTHRGDQIHDLGQGQAFAPQLGDAGRNAAGLAGRRIAEVFAAAAYPMNLLGRVDRLKPGRKRARQVGGRRRRSARRARLQIDAGGRCVLAPLDCGAAVAFDEPEELCAALLAQHLADRLTEGMHILAQSRVFDRKLYALAIHNSHSLAARRELYEFAGANRIISRSGRRCDGDYPHSGPPLGLALERQAIKSDRKNRLAVAASGGG